ncbi:hypothetical protein CEXT_33431 [Caerostris extrusa]|uniref:Uncharacterized protein n=1 Tax=Caerostris extrusa TaxID=172846 RepID=A0AAV4UT58_CAEEX|nr:hypothetical protein CEXT_33431 [Caerostris extrusa]
MTRNVSNQGEPSPFIEHLINTGDHLPIASPQNKTSPALKQFNKSFLSPIRQLKNVVDLLEKTGLPVFQRSLLVPP